ncbi:hypothetical protein [Cellulomonas sp. URHE0023]|uniref:hypothetical protein n=1 Tax=Cellulomonas sp. URHE0023 TaxID=1380354 RepID=UPI000485DB12|nr:hypothetical protein [Cellulomonas sp. URHE0023]
MIRGLRWKRDAHPAPVGARVLGAVRTGDLDAVVALVTAEADRPAVRNALLGDLPTDAPGHAARDLALFAIGEAGGWSVWSVLNLPDGASRGVDAVVAVGHVRGSAWSTATVASWLSAWPNAQHWRIAHSWVRSGLVPEPTVDEYAVWALYPPVNETLESLVQADPDLGRVLRRVFTSTGAGIAFSQHPSSVTAFVGALGGRTGPAREELLEGALAALDTPLTVTDLRGWSRVVDHLAPTPTEVAERSDTFVAMLGAPSAVRVGVAQRALATQVKHGAGSVDGSALVSVSRGVLARPERGLVKAQLRLLGEAHKRALVPVKDLAVCLEESIDPDRPDLAAMATELLKVISPTRVATPRTPVRGPSQPAPAPVDLPEPGTLELVHDADELVDLLAHVLARPGDPADLERVYDGMVRFPSSDSRAARTLLRAAGAWVPSFESSAFSQRRTMSDAVGGLVLAWLGEPVPAAVVGVTRCGYLHDMHTPAPPGATVRNQSSSERTAVEGVRRVTHSRYWEVDVPSWIPSVLTFRRTVELRDLVGTGSPLLSTPTRSDGSLDGETLVRRLATVPRRPHDLGTALLRLDPADRHLLGPAVSAELAQLGDRDRWVPSTHPMPPKHFRLTSPGLFWDAANAPVGSPDDPVAGWLDTSTIVDGWDDHLDVVDWHDTRWALGPAHWTSVLVHDPDLLAAHLVPLLLYSAEKSRADFGRVAQALGSSRVPLGGPAASALVRLAGFKDVTVRTVTAEALADAALRGTLDGELLGGELTRLVVPGGDSAPKLNRVAATLADCARIHEHAEVLVLDAVVAMLPVLRTLRGGAELLEPAAQIAERRGVRVDLPPDLGDLARGRSTTRVAAAVRRLGAV